MTYPTIPEHVPAGVAPEGDGVVIGAGPVRVDAFIDFLCPFCRQFELSSGPALAALVADQLASLVYHPMNFLDQASTTNYSTRAAAASGCAADQGRFLEYAHALFVNQPPEGGPGLSDAELAVIGRSVGLGDAAFAACLSEASLPGLAALRHRAGHRGRRQRHADRTGPGRSCQAGPAGDHRRRRPGRQRAMTWESARESGVARVTGCRPSGW